MKKYSKEKKTLLIILLILLITFCLILLFMFVLISQNSHINAMLQYYSDDNNYQKCKAKIVEIINDNNYKIDSLISIDDKEIPLSHQKYARIFSNNIEYTISKFEPLVGKEFEFKTCFAFYDTISFLPIVEIYVDDNLILDYEIGKSVLLSWAESFGR